MTTLFINIGRSTGSHHVYCVP